MGRPRRPSNFDRGAAQYCSVSVQSQATATTKKTAAYQHPSKLLSLLLLPTKKPHLQHLGAMWVNVFRARLQATAEVG